MKKKSKFISKYLNPVKLYMDDIDEIVSKIQHICSELEFSDKDYEYDSLEELIKHSGDKLRELSIIGREPYISLDITKYNIGLYTAGESDEAVCLFYFFKDFLRNKSKWYWKFLKPFVWGNMLIPATFIFLAAWFANGISSGVARVAFVVLSIIFLLFILSILKYLEGSTIYLKKRYKVISFLERNRDNIVMAIITGIIFLIGTIVSKFIFK